MPLLGHQAVLVPTGHKAVLVTIEPPSFFATESIPSSECGCYLANMHQFDFQLHSQTSEILMDVNTFKEEVTVVA